MKKIAGSIFARSAASAFAADLPLDTKAPAPIVAPAYDRTGGHVRPLWVETGQYLQKVLSARSRVGDGRETQYAIGWSVAEQRICNGKLGMVFCERLCG